MMRASLPLVHFTLNLFPCIVFGRIGEAKDRLADEPAASRPSWVANFARLISWK